MPTGTSKQASKQASMIHHDANNEKGTIES